MSADGDVCFVDLFAGCGGLSLGLAQAGLRPLVAVERSAMAAETYFHNFIARIRRDQDFPRHLVIGRHEQLEAGLVVSDVGELLSDDQAVATLRPKVDVLAGGPPCQGFSLAGLRDPNDQRNRLVWEFLRGAELLQPSVVLMENVAGLGHSFTGSENSTLGALASALRTIGPGYYVEQLVLNAKDYGVPQSRPRRFLVGLRSDFASGRQVVPRLIESARDDRVTVGEALVDIGPGGYLAGSSALLYATPSGAYAKSMRTAREMFPPAGSEDSVPQVLPNHDLRKHSELVETRFRVMQYLNGQGISHRVLQQGRDPSPQLTDAYVPAFDAGGVELAGTKQELIALVRQLQNKKHSQRALDACQPAPTVMTLPDDFVHPTEPRTLSVREMARLQSFPDAFEFRSKATTGGEARRTEVPQYTQVGNAVAPLLARAIGVVLKDLFQ